MSRAGAASRSCPRSGKQIVGAAAVAALHALRAVCHATVSRARPVIRRTRGRRGCRSRRAPPATAPRLLALRRPTSPTRISSVPSRPSLTAEASCSGALPCPGVASGTPALHGAVTRAPGGQTYRSPLPSG